MYAYYICTYTNNDKRGHECEKRERNGILEALEGGKRRENNIILL